MQKQSGEIPAILDPERISAGATRLADVLLYESRGKSRARRMHDSPKEREAASWVQSEFCPVVPALILGQFNNEKTALRPLSNRPQRH